MTERRYLEDLRKEERIPIDLQFRAGAVPKTLVQWAVEEKKAADSDPYDEVWVVFDVDEHPDVAAAKARAVANDVRVAVSNPSFELWALLHFEFWSSSIGRDKLRQRCVKHMPGYKKRLPFAVISPRYDKALENARRLARWHEDRGTAGANPSTGVYELTESIRGRRS